MALLARWIQAALQLIWRLETRGQYSGVGSPEKLWHAEGDGAGRWVEMQQIACVVREGRVVYFLEVTDRYSVGH